LNFQTPARPQKTKEKKKKRKKREGQTRKREGTKSATGSLTLFYNNGRKKEGEEKSQRKER